MLLWDVVNPLYDIGMSPQSLKDLEFSLRILEHFIVSASKYLNSVFLARTLAFAYFYH